MAALIEELNLSIRFLLEQTASDPDIVFFEDNPRALKVTYVLEKILSHGLKDTRIFGKSTFWEFLRHLPECLPAAEAHEKIETVSSMTKSELGRGRLFIRVALNDGCLPEYLSALIWNREILIQSYQDNALLRSEEHAGTLLLLIDTLKKVNFRMFLKDPVLDRPDFWHSIKFPDVASDYVESLPPSTTAPSRGSPSLGSTSTPQHHASSSSYSPSAQHSPQFARSTPASLEATHTALLDELKDSIRPIIATDNIIYDSSSDIPRFFSALETIFQTDFFDSKSIQLFGTTCFWAYLECIDQCLPEGAALKASMLSEAISIMSDLGKARAFLCLCMNDGSLAETLRSLMWNEALTADYYAVTSMLRDPEMVSILLTLIDSLTKVNFSLKINEPEYDDSTLWERRKRAVSQQQHDYRELMANRSPSALDPEDIVSHRSKKGGRRKKTKIIEIPNDSSPQKPPSATPRRKKVPPAQTPHAPSDPPTTTASQLDILPSSSPSFSQVQHIDPPTTASAHLDIPSPSFAQSTSHVSPAQSPHSIPLHDNIDVVSTPLTPQPPVSPNLSKLSHVDSPPTTTSLHLDILPSASPNLSHAQPLDPPTIASLHLDIPPPSSSLAQSPPLISPARSPHSITLHDAVPNPLTPQPPISPNLSKLHHVDSPATTPFHLDIPSPAQPPSLVSPVQFRQAPNSITLTDDSLASNFALLSHPETSADVKVPAAKPRIKSTNEPSTSSDLSMLVHSGSDIAEPELTLSMNRYIKGSLIAARCKGCGTIFERPTLFKKSQARFCYYTGGWYCRDCHDNEVSIIPGQILHRWDFTKYPVSSQSLYQIKSQSTKPMLDILVLNPELYSITADLNEIRRLRTKLIMIADFCRSCQRSASSLFHQLQGRLYLVEEIHIYSLNDLEAVHRKKFAAALTTIAKLFLDHIYSCVVCKGRGFLCMKCNNGELLFPFENTKIHRCPACSAVYHKHCFKPTEGDQCISCQLRAEMKQKRTSIQ